MFGEKLKNARISKNLKQSEIAELLNVKNTTISNWEKGVSNPDIEYVSTICRILGVSPSYFFDEMCNCELSLIEDEHIKKYRTLDDYGKKQVDTTLENEYTRCTSESDGKAFNDYDKAYDYLTQSQMFAMGGLDIESMEKNELIDFANDMYEMDKKASKYIK